MKTIGDQAKAFRVARGWSVKEMAAACKTSRQNIETLEAKGDRVPRYVKDLAHVMGTTVDTLMEGRYRVGAAPIAQAPATPTVQPQEPLLEPDEITLALRVLARAVTGVDKATQAAVSHLVSLALAEPDQYVNIAQTIGKLLPTRQVARRLHDDDLEGGLILDLPGGGLNPSEQRVSDQKRAKR